MKKILLLIIVTAIAICSYAQTDPNRTAKTKVSDALALLPAQNESTQTRLVGDLISSGSEGIAVLTSMFDNTNNIPVSYALSGWANAVSNGNAAAQKVFVDGIIKALPTASNDEVKAFYIKLLQIAGGDESVEMLAKLVSDKRLGDPALAALVAIGTPKARGVVNTAVKSGSGDKISLAKAAGDLGDTDVETTLVSWLGTGNDKLDNTIFTSLGKVGTISSLAILASAAQNANYTADNTNANRSYLALMQKLANDGRSKEISAEATKLMKKAAIKKANHTRIAAMQLYVKTEGHSSVPFIIKALDDSDRAYRNSALAASLPYVDNQFTTQLLSKLAKSTNVEAKIDIVNFLGNNKINSALPAIIPIIGNKNSDLSIAAMWAATNIGGEQVPAELVSILKNEATPVDVLTNVYECLLAYKGYVNDVVASAVESGPIYGQCVALGVLSSRHAIEKADVVIAATKSSDPTVSTTAFTALKNTVSQTELPTLYSMLETLDEKYAAYIQPAIVAALSTLTLESQVAAIEKQMAKNESKKALYYPVLAGTQAPQALEIIGDGYAKGDDAQKAQAVTALLQWTGVESAAKLFDVAKNGDAKFFDKSLSRFVQIVSSSDQTPEIKLINYRKAIEIAKTPAQLRSILRQIEATKTFQAFILAGKYLDNGDKQVVQAAANAVMNIALANKSFYGVEVVSLLNKAGSLLTGQDSSYQRESIAKHIASLPKEGGYVSLFNERDLTGWKGLVADPIARSKMTPAEIAQKQVAADEAMRRDWSVVDGILTFTGSGYDNICTQNQYGDFEMYVDWLLYPDGPDADAGVYLRGSPQVQMWDIRRTNVGAQVGSGGLYNNKVNPKNPSNVADNALGEWNTFYIKMVADRVTVVLNGEKVVDNVILENFWDRKQPIFPFEQIELQAHGTRVGYRNIYINTLPAKEPFKLSAEEQKEGYEALFDGANMYNWEGNTTDYVVENGVIALYPVNNGGGNLYTKKEYEDFIFRFEFMLTDDANNGLGIRTPIDGDAAYVGMELQILDDDAAIYSTLEEYQYHGSIYGVIAAKRGALKPNGEWNYQEVIAKGNKIKVTLNGTVILDGDIAEASKSGTLDHKDHPGLLNKSGRIAFLGHGSIVKFKNIRIKSLK